VELVLTPALTRYMREKNRQAVVLDVASANASDIEITELFCRLVKESQIPYLVEKKRFHPREAAGFTVLLPNYRLAYDDVVTFDLKKRLCFRSVTVTGARI